MNFHLKSDRYERKKIPILKGITIVFVCAILIQFITPRFLPSIALRFIAPLWPVKGDDSAQTIAELKNQIDSFSIMENEYKTILAELGQKKPNEFILGHVLVAPPTSLYDTLIVDAGSKEGVQIGKKVYAGGMITLGVITEVQGETSKVKLYSSPEEKYDVIIGVGSTSIRSTATGRGGGMYEVLAPREAKIQIGDVVTVPELSDVVYGKVAYIISDPARAFASIVFQSPIPLQSIRRVYVEK